MSTTHDTDGTERVEYPDLQRGWSWWSAIASRSYYTQWFGTKYRFGGDLVHDGCIGGYEGEVYWDSGGDHIVCLYPITGIRQDGDRRVAPYPEIIQSYDTKQDAVNAVPELIRELKERHG